MVWELYGCMFHSRVLCVVLCGGKWKILSCGLEIWSLIQLHVARKLSVNIIAIVFLKFFVSRNFAKIFFVENFKKKLQKVLPSLTNEVWTNCCQFFFFQKYVFTNCGRCSFCFLISVFSECKSVFSPRYDLCQLKLLQKFESIIESWNHRLILKIQIIYCILCLIFFW